jgi:hypothetical protein
VFLAEVGDMIEVGHAISGPRPMPVTLSFVLPNLRLESSDFVPHQQTPICDEWLKKMLRKCYEVRLGVQNDWRLTHII